jgi:hypothetical protein
MQPMHFGSDDDGLTDELTEEIRRELELGPVDDTRALAAVRAGDEDLLEVVLYDEDSGEPDVVVALTREQAHALAEALVARARAAPKDG